MSGNKARKPTVDLARTWPEWPTYGLVDDLLPTIETWANAGTPVALATLVNIVGSSPRPLGSEMAISADGEVAGYVSGGCVEGAVAGEALQVMATGKPRFLDYGAGSPVLDVQLTCGGRIGIFVRALVDAADYAARLRDARNKREVLEIHIDLDSGRQAYASPSKPTLQTSGSIFIKPCLPTVRLHVLGRNPVALAVCQLASHFGCEVHFHVPYGPPTPPPGAQLASYDNRSLSKIVDGMAIDEWTAVYALTHHPDDDLAVLTRALPSPAFAVGVLGSRTKIRERMQHLAAAGLGKNATARLSTPAGLDIGGKHPQDIALSIIAEIVSLQPHPVCLAPLDSPLLPQNADNLRPSACCTPGN